MLTEKMRENGFWIVDALRWKGQVRQYYLNLKKVLGDNDTNASYREILSHACATTDFYKPFRGYSDIAAFPIINKRTIKEHLEQFISSAYKGKTLHAARTSGSSGERFMIKQNREKRNRVLAELIYYNEQCGFHLGERYIYSRMWYEDNRKSKLVQIAENMLPLNCSSLSDTSLEKLFDLLRKDRSIKMLKGYASSLAAVADYFDRQGFTPNLFHLKLIVSGAERLDPVIKTALKKVFGCTVVSRYANNENGVLAQQGLNDDVFYLNTAHYYFECLQPDHDEPATFGQPARLVLTDLYNWATPMIRYDTGDLVIAERMEGKQGKIVLLDIAGRCDEVITDTRNNKISPHAVGLHFKQFDRIMRYQVVQNSPVDFVLNLEGIRGVYDDAYLKQKFQEFVGKDAKVEIAHLDKIPQAATGKLKKVVRNY